MSKQLMQQPGGSPALTFNPETVETIKNTVAKGATNNELEMFLHLCSTYQLDPFRKEIWFIKFGGKDPTIMTSRDGYLKIAQQHPDYLGIMSQEVRANDFFELDAAAGTVIHKFAQPISQRGSIVGAWSTVKRKGMAPVSIFVNFDEYKGNSGIWKQYPSAMIIKVAESFALKRQFGITGLVTREEMDVQGDYAPPETPGAPQGSHNTNTRGAQQTPQNEPPVQSEGQVMIPSANDVNKTRELLLWSPEQMMINVNAWLQLHQIQPVQKWKDLDPKLKAAFYDVMVRKLQQKMGAEVQ